MFRPENRKRVVVEIDGSSASETNVLESTQDVRITCVALRMRRWAMGIRGWEFWRGKGE